MMYRYYDGDATWMAVVMPLMSLVLVGFAVWLAVRLTHDRSGQHMTPQPGEQQRETPEQILDRRFASGEIDAATHTAARRHLEQSSR